MAIFNTTLLENYSDNSYTDTSNIEATTECGYRIAAESYGEVTNLIAGLYISDVLIETSVMEGADVVPLVENAFTDFLRKVKAKFIAIKNKIKAWFKKIINNLKIRFTSSKKFVSKYKNQLLSRGVPKIEMDAYGLPKTDILGKIESIVGQISTYAAQEKQENYSNNNDDDESNIDQEKEKIIKYISSDADELGEAKENLQEELLGEKELINVVPNISGMITFCEQSDKTINKLNKLDTSTEKSINDFIKGVDKQIVGFNKAASASGVSDVDKKYNTDAIVGARRAIAVMNFAITAIQQLNSFAVGLVKSLNGHYVAILRKVMLHKPSKESYAGYSEDSLFESALNIL